MKKLNYTLCANGFTFVITRHENGEVTLFETKPNGRSYSHVDVETLDEAFQKARKYIETSKKWTAKRGLI